MFKKLKAILDLFRKGQSVVNVEAWKNGQITGAIVGGLIIAGVNLAHLFGLDLPVDLDTANTIGAGIVAVAHVVLTVITSKRAGILPAKPAEPVQSHTTGMLTPDRIPDAVRPYDYSPPNPDQGLP